MSSPCSCPVVIDDSVCTLCKGVVLPPMADSLADNVHLFNRIVSDETVLSFGILPEDWTADAKSQLRECMILHFKEQPDRTEEEWKDECEGEVFRIVYTAFWDEYGDILKSFQLVKLGIQEAYDKRVELGVREFNKYLGKELQFDKFCRDFYDQLRDRYNIDGIGMRNEFERMRANKWEFYQYAMDLASRKKR